MLINECFGGGVRKGYNEEDTLIIKVHKAKNSVAKVVKS